MQTDPAPSYCPVCRSSQISTWSSAHDYEYFSVPGEYQYYHCADCLTIFIDPVPVEQLKQIYPPNYYSFVNSSKTLVARIKEWMDKIHFKKVLRDMEGDQLHVLDVGGGTGWLLSNLKKTEPRISFTQVVDINEEAGEIARRDGHAYFEGTIETFQTDKKFHLILMLNLVEHVADPHALMEKAAALLTPGGIILVKTPNTDSWDARLYRNTYWGGLHCPRHWIIFSEKSFRLLVYTTSLSIKKINYTQGAPFWAFSIMAAWHRKKWIRISAKRPIIFHWLFAPLSAIFAVFDFLRRPFAKTSQMFIVLGKR